MNAPSSQNIETPCVQLCVVDPDSGFCIGCGRTTAEIGGWTAMTVAERREVMAKLDQRMDSLTRTKRRKGGAQGRRG